MSVRDSFHADPLPIKESVNQEDSFRTGGYAHRQLLELVQNGADALLRNGSPGRLEIRLVDDVLYCANEGAPFGQGGIEAITHAFISSKKGDEIGRFGLGFKSVWPLRRPRMFSVGRLASGLTRQCRQSPCRTCFRPVDELRCSASLTC